MKNANKNRTAELVVSTLACLTYEDTAYTLSDVRVVTPSLRTVYYWGDPTPSSSRTVVLEMTLPVDVSSTSLSDLAEEVGLDLSTLTRGSRKARRGSRRRGKQRARNVRKQLKQLPAQPKC